VADVVQQPGEPVCLYRLRRERQRFGQLSGEMHDTERMLEPRVCSARIHRIGQPEMCNPTEPLDRRCAYHIQFHLVDRNEPVKRVTNIFHKPNLSHVLLKPPSKRSSFLVALCLPIGRRLDTTEMGGAGHDGLS